MRSGPHVAAVIFLFCGRLLHHCTEVFIYQLPLEGLSALLRAAIVDRLRAPTVAAVLLLYIQSVDDVDN